MADNTMGLTADVTNGVLNYAASEETTSTTKKGTGELGKDAFLQLLVCQMQNQDPLEPSSDTEFVSQLAQFSSLEQLQNLSGEQQKAQAFSLVGRHVIFQVTDTNGKTTYPEGPVDFVNMSGKDIKLNIGGQFYDYKDLYMVVDDVYEMQQSIPGIEQNYDFTYNVKAPERMRFNVNLGKDDYKAGDVALVVGGQAIDGQFVSCKDGMVTVEAGALDGFANGEYPVSVVFNNKIYTTVNDKVTITVVNSEVG